MTNADVPLSPTTRTTPTRNADRMVAERDRLHRFLAVALVAHVGVHTGEHPVVLPTAFGFDPDGPDEGGSLYLHGSVAAGWLRRSPDATVCVTITEVDGLVAARSAFHHSMNYRSAVIIGPARQVTDETERQHALDLIVDHVIPGRSATMRASTRKELAATVVVAVPMVETSMKMREGDPVDEPEDVAAGVWAGVIPLRRVAAAPLSAADSHDEVPDDVLRRTADLAWEPDR